MASKIRGECERCEHYAGPGHPDGCRVAGPLENARMRPVWTEGGRKCRGDFRERKRDDE